MTTVRKDIEVDESAGAVWTALKDFGAADKLFAGVLTGCRRDGDERRVTFAGGQEVLERLISLDEADRRIVYGVVGGAFSHHSASLQVFSTPTGCRIVWYSDFLPEAAKTMVEPLAEAGSQALKRNLPALLVDL